VAFFMPVQQRSTATATRRAACPTGR